MRTLPTWPTIVGFRPYWALCLLALGSGCSARLASEQADAGPCGPNCTDAAAVALGQGAAPKDAGTLALETPVESPEAGAKFAACQVLVCTPDEPRACLGVDYVPLRQQLNAPDSGGEAPKPAAEGKADAGTRTEGLSARESSADAGLLAPGSEESAGDEQSRDASAAPVPQGPADAGAPPPADATVSEPEPSADGGIALGSSDAGAPPALVAPADLDGGVVESLAPVEDEPVQLSCQFSVDARGDLHTGCLPSGEGEDGAPCVASRDCTAGLACVGDERTGRCLPVCCGGDAQCGEARFCAERPLRVAGQSSRSEALVPVCAPAEACDLSADYPCEGPDCTCSPGTACTVVADGATACLPPKGEGTQGDACPCAAGHVCSEGARTCLKLCQVSRESNQRLDGTEQDPRVSCAEGAFCQATPRYPEGWGLCVVGLDP